MSGVNKVILIGHLGRDPELKYLEGSIAKLSFSLATKETYKDKAGNKVDHTEWHNIVLWRNLAENAEKFLKKGLKFMWKESCKPANGKTRMDIKKILPK